MKRIGFLSFGHWSDTRHSQARTAADSLLQAIDLAVAAEEPRGRRCLLPGPSLRAADGLAVSVAGRDRRQDVADRDRHRCDRHAVREPPLHGRGQPAPPTSSPAAGSSSASAGDPRSRSSTAGATSGTRPVATTPRPTWRASTPRCCCPYWRARGSPSRTRGPCSPTRRDSSASSRTPRDCGSASGGVPRPTPPRSGRPSSA